MGTEIEPRESRRERLPIDGGASHLALRLDRPVEPLAGAPTILYMHGFGSCQDGDKADFFRRRAVLDGFPFCSFDFQGHGESGGSMLELTLSRNLLDIGVAHDFLRREGLGWVVLLGSSMGGASAIWYAALHPEDVAAGMHIAPALGLDKGLLSWAGEEGVREWRREGRRRFSNDLVTCDLGWGLIEDIQAYDRDRLSHLYRCPTLLIQGMEDESVPWREVLDFVLGCEHAGLELRLIGDGDHRFLDRLDELWGLMRGFLEARGIVSP